MGIIADTFSARIAEMQVRHEESERRLQAHLARSFELLEQMRVASDAMLEEFENV
jgi:hypothetical protein